MTDQSTPLDRFPLEPETRARLLDREQVVNTYAVTGLRQAAKEFGVGRVVFALALNYHGERVRKRGEPAPGIRPTRTAIERATYRAYARSGRCPPSCPGRDQCLMPGGKCILEELL